MNKEDTESRGYRMTARAESVRATGEAILDAAAAAFGVEAFDRVTLNQIADASGVTVQTVLRRFGSKEQLFAEAARREGERIRSQRLVPVEAGLEAALQALVEHYERDGDIVLNLMAQEAQNELVAGVLDEGRRTHREWVIRHCRVGEANQDIGAAIVATDLGTWKLLRRDMGMEIGEVIDVMLRLLRGLERRK